MNKFSLVAIPVLCLLISGCVPLIIGGVGVLGGYAISRDTIAAESSRGSEDIWKAAKDVLPVMGIIKSIDEDTKTIEANIYSSVVIVRVEKITEATNRLKVKARKFMMPNIGLAEKIFVKIMQRLEGNSR
jgi:hypothetical protein